MAKKPTRAINGEWTDDYRAWLTVLEDDVVIEQFGYERGEFTVYPESWEALYSEGLTPREAWQRALDAHGERRREEEAAKKANWERIQREDAAIRNGSATATHGEDGAQP